MDTEKYISAIVVGALTDTMKTFAGQEAKKILDGLESGDPSYVEEAKRFISENA